MSIQETDFKHFTKSLNALVGCLLTKARPYAVARFLRIMGLSESSPKEVDLDDGGDVKWIELLLSWQLRDQFSFDILDRTLSRLEENPREIKANVAALEKIINYTFNNVDLLLQATSHSTHSGVTGCYER